MKILLTGATGVIGRRVVPLALSAGHEVTAIVRSPPKAAALGLGGARIVQADLFDAGAVMHAVADHDIVVNLATHMPSSSARLLLRSAWRQNDRIRRLASRNLVAAARGSRVRVFIQESFAPVYPDRGELWIDETVPISPARYNESIEDAEHNALGFSDSGRRGIVLRFGAFYGADARHCMDLIHAVRKGWAPIPGSPDAFVSSITHEDAARAVLAALDLQSGIYNITDDEPVPRRDYAGALAAALGVPAPKFLPPGFKYLLGSAGRLLARSQRISNGKFKQAAGFTCRYPSVRSGWPAVIAELTSGGVAQVQAEAATERRTRSRA
ncbi:MAG TPA: NAD(P)-dependent oxidoreductase [Rhodanobacteraceae bacterium]|nr:NAD(P)-dependent oxidoreductase [Rhodanobacteraceae bacterium]